MATQIEQQLYPHKMVALGNLKQIDGPLFTLDGVDLVFDPSVMESLNRQIGTNRTQLEMVRNASGDIGEVNFRNFLSNAHSLTDNKDVVIVASPETRHIVNVVIPKNEFIPVRQFFDFAGIFMEEAGYDFEKIQTNRSGAFDVTIFMQSRQPTVQAFARGEDTITDGAYLNWTGDSIELGNYYTRLVCTNGATQTVQRRQTRLHTLRPAEVRAMIELARERILPKIGFQTFQEKALEAMDTQCSLAELRRLTRTLTSHSIGLDKEMADSILPTPRYEEYFVARGVDINRQASIVKTDMTVWTVFNILTAFATHTDLLAHDDSTRSVIMNAASDFLQRERDIKHYIDYE